MATSLYARALVRAYDSSTYQSVVDTDISAVATLTQEVLRQYKHQVSSSVTAQSISLGDIDSAVGIYISSDVPVTVYVNSSAAASARALSASGFIVEQGTQIGTVWVTNDNAASVANIDLIAWK